MVQRASPGANALDTDRPDDGAAPRGRLGLFECGVTGDEPAARPASSRLPWLSLLLLAAVGFLLVAAETAPAGLLAVMADDLRVSEGTVGQLVSVWALGTVLVTAPVIRRTRHLRRKPMLLTALAGVILANTVTAAVSQLPILLACRFVAGAFTGIIWAMVAGYSRRISPPRLAGRALAIAYAGAPFGFAVGTPLAAALGEAVGWRWSFAAISGSAVVVLLLTAAVVPDAGRPAAVPAVPLRVVFLLPGVRNAILVLVLWALAHTVVYTYIAPYLRASGTDLRVDVLLFVYGISAIAGVGVAAAALDRSPRRLVHATTTLFTVAALALLIGHRSTPVVLAATVVWGVTYGSAAAQLQSALARAGREQSEVANAFLPVGFNIAIFAAGVLGAVLLSHADGLILPAVMAALGAATVAAARYGRRSAFAADR